MALPGAGGWTLWRHLSLRGAGFPVRWVLELSASDAAAAADRVLAAERAHRGAGANASALLERRAAEAGPQERPVWSKARRALARGTPPDLRAPDPELGAALAEVERAASGRQQAQVAAEGAYAADGARVSAFLRSIAAHPRFREAIVWQNRPALKATLDGLLRAPPGSSTSESRRRERVVASYLQRYCAKNESIGFFGPWGWATFDDRAATVSLSPGPQLVGRRELFYEYWAIDCLAAALVREDPELLLHLPPRRHPQLLLEGERAVLPGRAAEALDARERALLGGADGATSALELLRRCELPLEDGRAALLGLVERGLAFWSLELPTHVAPPGGCLDYPRDLRRRLEAVADAGPRERALSRLAELEQAKARVEAARGAPAELDEAIAAFEQTFTRLTLAPANRNAGKTYAGRTIFFEDCVRDAQVAFGRPFLEAVGPALGLLFTSARWYTHAVATRYRALLGEAYRRVRGGGAAPVRYLDYWTEVAPLFAGPQHKDAVVDEVQRELHARWRAVLEPARERGSARRIDLTCAEIAAAVARSFAAPCPGWPLARYHAPDLLLAAQDAQALARGELLVVLGEIHTGVSTLAKPLMYNLHPDPEALVRGVEADLPLPRIMRPETRDSFMTQRLGHCSFNRQDVQLETGRTVGWRPRDQVVRASELWVEERDGLLEIRTADGRRRFDVIAFFEEHLRYKSTTRYSVMPAFTETASHSPRVTIDRLVLSHERWRFARSDLGFAEAQSAHQRWLSTRRWAQAVGLPRFVFAKVPEERKPYFLDLDSPTLVELFCKLIRDGSALTVTEMIPSIEESWLMDREGNHYTSELRITAVDPEPWRP